MAVKRSKIPGTPARKVAGSGSFGRGPSRVPGGPRMVGGLMTPIARQSSSQGFMRAHQRQLRDLGGKFMTQEGGIAWQGLDVVAANIAGLEDRINEAAQRAADVLAKDMEDYAKQNASWDDKSGDARDGIQSRVIQDGQIIRIFLGHTVDYGIWLEVRWGGKFAIILPTVLTFAARYAGEVKAHL